MTTYRLKDRDLQSRIEALIPNFGSALQSCCNRQMADNFDCVIVRAGKPRHWEVYFKKDEIEVVGEYDPKKWNRYPDVTPPERVLMLVETEEKNCYPAIFRNGEWRSQMSTEPNTVFYVNIKNVKRFRPWVSPDEEE